MLDFSELIDLAEQRGWRVKDCANNHKQLLSPDGEKIVTVGSTPSDRRALMNFTADLRRAGLVITDEQPKHRFKPHELTPLILKIMAEKPTDVWDIDALTTRVRGTYPDTTKQPIYNAASDLHKAGKVVRLGNGVYRLAPQSETTNGAIAIERGVPMPGVTNRAAPPAAYPSAITASAGQSADMTELNACVDQILDGVARLQGVVGRVHGVMSQLDALRAVLNPRSPS